MFSRSKLSFTAMVLLAHLSSSSVIGTAIAKPIQAARAVEESHTSAANNTRTAAETQALIVNLKTAATAVDRYKLLMPADYGYDFNAPPDGATTKGAGGFTVKADAKTFPALIGSGISMTVGFIGPCGFNTPHVHPRSAEFNIVVKGALHAEFIAENGATIVSHDATAFQSIIFPQAAMHTEFNPTCDESIFVAGFASEDPGVQQTVQTFFGLDADVVQAATNAEWLSGDQLDKFRASIPPNVARGVGECLQKCGISTK